MRGKSPPFISIVIPVYNEEKRIHLFLSRVIDYLHHTPCRYELVIVDDGSTDGTVPLVKSLLNSHLPDRYTLIRLPTNRGKGAAVQKGMLASGGEYIFFTDADGSTPIEEIDNFITHFSPDYDIYIGRRTLKQKAPLKRKFFGYGYILLANLLLHLKVSDITCGFKCYTRRCVQPIFSRQKLNNWSFDAEDLFIARKHGYAIKEIPVQWEHAPGSKVKVMKNAIVCGMDLVRITFNDIKGFYT